MGNVRNDLAERALRRKLSGENIGELCMLHTGPGTGSVFICVGFQMKPYDLLLPMSTPDSFRLPLAVSSIQCIFLDGNLVAFPICPRCNISLDREPAFLWSLWTETGLVPLP